MSEVLTVLFWTFFGAVSLGFLIFMAPFMADPANTSATMSEMWQDFKSYPRIDAVIVQGAILGFVMNAVRVTDGFVSAVIMTLGSLYFFWLSGRLVLNREFAKRTTDGQFQALGVVMLMSVFFLITGFWRMIFA